MSVVIKLNSWTNKLDAIKFVRGVTGLGLHEAKDIVEGQLPANIKEYNSKAEADAIIASNPNKANYDNLIFELIGGVPSVLIRSTGIGIVSGNPNEILELQSNHLFSKVQSIDGEYKWIFKPNNPAGEKWIEEIDFSQSSKIENLDVKCKNLETENVSVVNISSSKISTNKLSLLEQNGNNIQAASNYPVGTLSMFKLDGDNSSLKIVRNVDGVKEWYTIF